MFLVQIDCNDINSKLDFMKAMDNAFGFPPYFGENWDALWGCMRDLYWIKSQQIHLSIVNGDQLTNKLRMEITTFFDDLLKDGINNLLVEETSKKAFSFEII